MINKDTAATLVAYARAVEKYGKASDKERRDAVTEENRRRAWVLLKVLKGYCEHLEQSDFYSLLSEMSAKTPKDRERCGRIAQREQFELALTIAEFNKRYGEFEKTPARAVAKQPEDESLLDALRKPTAKQATTKKADAKKPVAKKATSKKVVAKKAVAKKTAFKKAA
ncbi:hypothetical protein [Noviherbaspirillum pedocola]|uniref:Uncharacterized protein n=1 Tax=Noviherbaspirillum pedocola TaxID=2801341 RepID=A0A934SUG3_9BURK|nr:hypothetical protein [Noviherbaspirillum pedocola]MBK4733037.1 hypothetical protein [Noviherbaspirillum pedocola]